MQRQAPPAEEEQVAAYRRAFEAFGPGRPVVVRLADIGGDKGIPYLGLPAEANPFLGVRAIRLAYRDPELLRTQLRAIWRAGGLAGVVPHVMAPMVATLEDVDLLDALRDEARAAVVAAGHPCADDDGDRDHGGDPRGRPPGPRAGPPGRLLQHRDERPDPVPHGRRPGQRRPGPVPGRAPPGGPAGDRGRGGGGRRGGHPGGRLRGARRRSGGRPRPRGPGRGRAVRRRRLARRGAGRAGRVAPWPSSGAGRGRPSSRRTRPPSATPAAVLLARGAGLAGPAAGAGPAA